jgi:hypothetical protein
MYAYLVLIGIHIFVFVARGAYQRDALPFSLKENKFIIIIIKGKLRDHNKSLDQSARYYINEDLSATNRKLFSQRPVEEKPSEVCVDCQLSYLRQRQQRRETLVVHL